MKYFSMFSGIGGFELGIQYALGSNQNKEVRQSTAETGSSGRPPEQLPKLGLEGLACVGYSEIDKYAIKVYEKQFRGHTNYGDATKINAAGLPDFDLLVGGFPCQAFSVAGKRAGFEDTRGTLFFDIARILAEKRPRHVLLENVKGLLSHDKGKTIQTIFGVLADLGYRIEWQLLNSKDFGVPQNRERIFIIGHLRDECRQKVFPITRTAGKDIEQLNKGVRETKRVYSDLGSSPTLNTAQGGQRVPKITQTIRELQEKHLIRRLTPKECERLQGFPDDWTKLGVSYKDDGGEGLIITERMSDTQRYKMCGNAVTVNVIEAIFRNFKCIENPAD